MSLDGAAVKNEYGTGSTVLGAPARPIVHDGEVFAAWLPQGDAEGVLWSSRSGPKALDYGGQRPRRRATTAVRRER